MARGETKPKKAKTVPSKGKVMATDFWDAKGVILVDYLEKWETINGQYYATLLGKLNEETKVKRPHLAKKKSRFFTKTMHQRTPALLRPQKFTSSNFSCCPTHHIHQISSQVTIFCSQTWKNGSEDKNVRGMTK